MEAAGFGVFFAFILVWVFGGMALWIWALVDVVRLPEHAFRAVGREKTSWVLVVVLAQAIGALVWLFGARKEVRAAYDAQPFPPAPTPMKWGGPPPGWYPDPSGAPGSVWWDGARWTGYRQDPPPPA